MCSCATSLSMHEVCMYIIQQVPSNSCMCDIFCVFKSLSNVSCVSVCPRCSMSCCVSVHVQSHVVYQAPQRHDLCSQLSALVCNLLIVSEQSTAARCTTVCWCHTQSECDVMFLPGFSVDWWALGVLMFEMMAGRSPFDIITDNPDMNTEEYLFQGEPDQWSIPILTVRLKPVA